MAKTPPFFFLPCLTTLILVTARANHLALPPPLRMRIEAQTPHYTVKISLGTFKSKPPYKEYYLEMDTGTSLTWLQCEGCIGCFKQAPAPYPKQKSSSFRPVLINCQPSKYLLKYADNYSTRGVLAAETFYLRSIDGRLVKADDLRFGCSSHTVMPYGRTRNNKIAGRIGLGSADYSFVNQLGALTKGRFSYCLPLLLKQPHTSAAYLRFGDEMQPRTARITPLRVREEFDGYFIVLQGISINGTRLNIRPEVFAELKNGTSSGGCIIDSGTHYARIVSPAFDAVKQGLEKYFSRFSNLKKVKKNTELCYERSKPAGFDGLPSMTFHLRGPRADFEMAAEAVFDVVAKNLFRREYFCLAMVRDPKMSVIGSYQQTNHRIIYDIMNKILVFYPEDCSSMYP